MKNYQNFTLFSSHLDLAHQYIRRLSISHPILVDATCGNGWDSLFLAEAFLPSGKLYCIDIQNIAIESTFKRLEEKLTLEQLSQVTMVHSSHEDLSPVTSSIDLIIYNLGYLPKGDKALTTSTLTTIKSLESALSLLSAAGLICITCYPGHAEGAIEEASLLEFCQKLDPRHYLVVHHKFLNRHQSPSLLLIQKQLIS